MILVGEGALLERALKYCIDRDLSVELVVTKTNLSISRFTKQKEIVCIQTDTLNKTLYETLLNWPPTIVFSINNNKIISDICLSLKHSFFNIHNGLVESYRGIGEVCVFAAVCNQERVYGATLQRLLPALPPDAGPIVASNHFKVELETSFYKLFKASLLNCQKLFEENIDDILNDSYEVNDVKVLGRLYSFKDIMDLGVATDEVITRKAMEMGNFEHFLPRLKASFTDVMKIIGK